MNGKQIDGMNVYEESFKDNKLRLVDVTMYGKVSVESEYEEGKL
jgi:hypothetical protein